MVPTGFTRLSDKTQITSLLPQDFFVVVRDVGGTPSLAIIERTDLGTELGGAADLSLGAITGTTLEIDNSAGANVVLPIANSTDAGLLSSAQSVLLGTLSANPGGSFYYGTDALGAFGYHPLPSGSGSTDLALGNITLDSLEITSSSGADVILPIATQTQAGLFSASDKTILDDIQVSPGNDFYYGTDATGAIDYYPFPASSGFTNLSIGSQSATTLEIESSSGANVLLPLADTSNAGILGSTDFDLLAILGTSPGNDFYYGTDITGTLDFYPLPSSANGGSLSVFVEATLTSSINFGAAGVGVPIIYDNEITDTLNIYDPVTGVISSPTDLTVTIPATIRLNITGMSNTDRLLINLFNLTDGVQEFPVQTEISNPSVNGFPNLTLIGRPFTLLAGKNYQIQFLNAGGGSGGSAFGGPNGQTNLTIWGVQ